MKYLIAGLGNIGPEYAGTRHNIGFQVLDHLAARHTVSFAPARYGDVARLRFKGRIFTLLKPSSYMNLSGKPVAYWMGKTGVEPGQLLVVTDDLALPTGTLRLRAKGGAGGHNGLGNIMEVLGTHEFARLRFGIGSDYPRGFQSQYVLSPWDDEEMREWVAPRLEEAADLILDFGLQGVERTMNKYNKRKPGQAETDSQ